MWDFFKEPETSSLTKFQLVVWTQKQTEIYGEETEFITVVDHNGNNLMVDRETLV